MWRNLSHVSRAAHNSCQTSMSQLLLGYAGAKVVVSDLHLLVIIINVAKFCHILM